MKVTLPCIVICLHGCLALYTNTKKNSLRVIGGRNATEDEFPYVVKLVMQTLTPRTPSKNDFLCSAAALTSKWTLTAAHCISAIEELLTARTAQIKPMVEYHPSTKAEVAYSEIMSMYEPPGVNVEEGKDDIGLLRTQPVLLGTYAKLSPIDFASLHGQEVSVVGYGMIKTDNDTVPLLAQVLQVIVKECHVKTNYAQICFAPLCSVQRSVTKALCPGDSGGPAIHASGVVSVNSKTVMLNCVTSLRPLTRRDRYDTGYEAGIAIPVSPFIDWISSNVKTDNDAS